MYTIGEFSKIAHASARMLRHYDALGLITPAEIGTENNYRYYDVSQLNRVFEIQNLQSYGIKLKDIPAILDKIPVEKYSYYQEAYKNLLKERKKLDQKLHLLYEQIQKMEGHTMKNEKIILLNNPEQCIYSIKRTIPITEVAIQQLFHDLYTELDEKGIQKTGVSQLIYLSPEFSTGNMDVEAQVQVSEDTPGSHHLPSCQCVSTLHHGTHKTIHTAYETIGKWLSEHREYHVCGPVIERFIVDNHEMNVFETGILFPVVKITH